MLRRMVLAQGLPERLRTNSAKDVCGRSAQAGY